MEQLLTTTELAAYLSVTKTTIYMWIKDKGFPRKKIGHLNRYAAQEVDEWIAKQTARANASAVNAKNMHPRLGRRDSHQPITFTLDQ